MPHLDTVLQQALLYKWFAVPYPCLAYAATAQVIASYGVASNFLLASPWQHLSASFHIQWSVPHSGDFLQRDQFVIKDDLCLVCNRELLGEHGWVKWLYSPVGCWLDSGFGMEMNLAGHRNHYNYEEHDPHF